MCWFKRQEPFARRLVCCHLWVSVSSWTSVPLSHMRDVSHCPASWHGGGAKENTMEPRAAGREGALQAWGWTGTMWT